MENVIAALISIFLMDPLKAELAERLAAARAPQAVIAEVRNCAERAVPAIVERASGDPWWVVQSTFSVWAGASRPDALLVEIAPACAGAVAAARPFLTGRGA